MENNTHMILELIIEPWVSSVEALKEAIFRLRYDTINYGKQAWDSHLLSYLSIIWSTLETQFLANKVSWKNLKRGGYTLDINLLSVLEKKYYQLKLQYRTLIRSHIRLFLHATKFQFKESTSQPASIIQTAINNGLPESWLAPLEKYYKDPITKQWIRFPLRVIEDKRTVRYYCADALEKTILKENALSKNLKLPHKNNILNLKNFRTVENARDYLTYLETFLAEVSKCYIKAMIDMSRETFKDRLSQPRYTIQKELKHGLSRLSLASLEECYQDPITKQWIKFPICLIDEQQTVRYYCATSLEKQLTLHPKGTWFTLPNKAAADCKLSYFKTIQPNGPYYDFLYRTLSYLKLEQKNLKQMISNSSFFTENSPNSAHSSVVSTNTSMFILEDTNSQEEKMDEIKIGFLGA